MLQQAANLLKPGGLIYATHWRRANAGKQRQAVRKGVHQDGPLGPSSRYDSSTPRGPPMDIRPRADPRVPKFRSQGNMLSKEELSLVVTGTCHMLSLPNFKPWWSLMKIWVTAELPVLIQPGPEQLEEWAAQTGRRLLISESLSRSLSFIVIACHRDKFVQIHCQVCYIKMRTQLQLCTLTIQNNTGQTEHDAGWIYVCLIERFLSHGQVFSWKCNSIVPMQDMHAGQDIFPIW